MNNWKPKLKTQCHTQRFQKMKYLVINFKKEIEDLYDKTKKTLTLIKGFKQGRNKRRD